MNPDDEQLRILIESNRADGNLITYQLLCELRERRASLSREKVLREALEETLRCITSESAGGYLAEMRDQNRRARWFLDKCIPAATAARAALASTETE